jgi:hypothetical protein
MNYCTSVRREEFGRDRSVIVIIDTQAGVKRHILAVLVLSDHAIYLGGLQL